MELLSVRNFQEESLPGTTEDVLGGGDLSDISENLIMSQLI